MSIQLINRHGKKIEIQSPPETEESLIGSSLVGIAAGLIFYSTAKSLDDRVIVLESQLVGSGCALIWYVVSQHFKNPVSHACSCFNRQISQRLSKLLS